MSAARVEFYQSRWKADPEDPRPSAPQEEHRWRVLSANNEIVASGEGYTTERDARRGFRNALNAMVDAALNYGGPLPD